MAKKKRGRGKNKRPANVALNIRLTAATIATYRATGPGWQTRIRRDLDSLVVPR